MSLQPRQDTPGGDANRRPGVVISLCDYRRKKGMGGSPKPRLLTDYRDCSAELKHLNCQVEKLLRRAAYMLGTLA